MENNHIPLDNKQEEALCALYESVGYNEGLSDVLTMLENKYGKVHTFTIEVRKMLNHGKGFDKREKANELSDSSNLGYILWKRFDEYKKNENNNINNI